MSKHRRDDLNDKEVWPSKFCHLTIQKRAKTIEKTFQIYCSRSRSSSNTRKKNHFRDEIKDKGKFKKLRKRIDKSPKKKNQRTKNRRTSSSRSKSISSSRDKSSSRSRSRTSRSDSRAKMKSRIRYRKRSSSRSASSDSSDSDRSKNNYKKDKYNRGKNFKKKTLKRNKRKDNDRNDSRSSSSSSSSSSSKSSDSSGSSSSSSNSSSSSDSSSSTNSDDTMNSLSVGEIGPKKYKYVHTSSKKPYKRKHTEDTKENAEKTSQFVWNQQLLLPNHIRSQIEVNIDNKVIFEYESPTCNTSQEVTTNSFDISESETAKNTLTHVVNQVALGFESLRSKIQNTSPKIHALIPQERTSLSNTSEFELENEEDSYVKIKRKELDLSAVDFVQINCLAKIPDPRKKLYRRFIMEEKLNLVLDLDETLLNSAVVNLDFDVKTLKHIPINLIKEINSDIVGSKIILLLRPYAFDFLKRVSRVANIFVYSHGWWEYVQRILEILDPEKKLIRRDIIFKNTGQVTGRTPKLITHLGLSAREADKTIIIDDQKFIWEGAHQKVLASKKFIPLKNLMPEEKFVRYMLFRKSENEVDPLWWLNYKQDPFGLKEYAEVNMNQMNSQLEALANFVEEIFEEYNFSKLLSTKNQASLKVEDLIKVRMKKIIRGWKVSIISPSIGRARMLGELVEILGGQIVEQDKAQYLLLDSNEHEYFKAQIQNQVNKHPLVTVIYASWLIECYFYGTKVDLNKYYVQFEPKKRLI